ncbi:hypothetical protein B0H34DRAFT_687373 [Crassisporium funariophilum]|nr:hypothetical protein B0H34DRAFT_687373 [Crassisporium funariophilum]
MYQPDVTANPYSTHYPNHYPATTSAALPATLPYFPTFQHGQPLKSAPAVDSAPPDPPEPSVTPDVASRAIQRLILFELQGAGYETAVQPTVHRLEVEVVTFIQQLFQRAHEYANLANRAGAIASDLLLACEDFNLPPKELYEVKKATTKRKRARAVPATLLAPLSRSPSPELLGSDDEDTPSNIPTTLRSLPSYFPDLPPKHTYLQTPASPPKKAALPSLEKKLKTAALVQESLQNLLLATEDNTNQEDGELLGHIVNWEMNTHPRKRWKVGAK